MIVTRRSVGFLRNVGRLSPSTHAATTSKAQRARRCTKTRSRNRFSWLDCHQAARVLIRRTPYSGVQQHNQPTPSCPALLPLRRLTRLIRINGWATERRPKKVVCECPHERALLIVGGASMPSLDVLPIEDIRRPTSEALWDLVEQRPHHLARMARVDTIILGARGEEDSGATGPCGILAYPLVLCHARKTRATEPMERRDSAQVTVPHARLLRCVRRGKAQTGDAQPQRRSPDTAA